MCRRKTQEATTWDYNADDTIQRITDARNASQTFIYNSRHLVSGIDYAAPSGIVPAPSSFGYDAAGNRAYMTDASGNTNINTTSFPGVRICRITTAGRAAKQCSHLAARESAHG